MTDKARFYKEVGKEFASHEAVNHGEKEYVRYWNEVTSETRPDGGVETTTIMTNTVAGYYSRASISTVRRSIYTAEPVIWRRGACHRARIRATRWRRPAGAQ
jgi:hypothetical protein